MYSSFGYAVFVDLLDKSSYDNKDFNKSDFTRNLIWTIDGKDSEFLNIQKNQDYVWRLNNMRCQTKAELALKLHEENPELEKFISKTLNENIQQAEFKQLIIAAINVTDFNVGQKEKLLACSDEPIEVFTTSVLEEVLRTGENSKKKNLKHYKTTVTDILTFGKFRDNELGKNKTEQVDENDERKKYEEDKQKQVGQRTPKAPIQKPLNKKTTRQTIHIWVAIICLAISIILFIKNQNTFNKIARGDTSLKTEISEVQEVKAGWGPARKTFSSLNLPDEVVFNSIENANLSGFFSGDERNFCVIKKVDSSEWKDEVVLEVGSEYKVINFFHNNSKSITAENVLMQANIPQTVKKDEAKKIYAIIDASNAKPKEVWNSVVIRSMENVSLKLIPESTRIISNGPVNDSKVDDSFFSDGAKIGFDHLDGTIPPNEYGQVVYRFEVVQPNFKVTIRVSRHNENDWQPTLDVKHGELVDFLVEFKNTGHTDMENVIIKMELPKELNYALDSTQIANGSSEFEPVDVSDGMTTGYNIGNYSPNSNAFIKFSAKLLYRDKEKGELIEVKAITSTSSEEKDSILKIAIDK
ncbi:hypothetical protein JZO70_20965 [Enterococcus sp. 669A]|uniref:DUF11 domain-containing protein n=1 Tax=Candidatus Enterococcus moelleringii TaxID=2815325 RepID=A0ABS3LHX0_9ENTE|nr:DUF11 domain-containing protein [Enterococcus sp. 669A]MBO1308658.1 hypothetical protein [Enterococcus sp. 669A]